MSDIQYYPYKYFSGANITVEMDSNNLLECAGISFVVNESNQPVYGYASNLYDAVIPGRRVIQGSFVVNFTTSKDNATNHLLEKIKERGRSFTRNSPLFNIKVTYGLGIQKKESYILSNCFLISQGQTIQISENVILEEYSFIARDIFVEGRTETITEDKNNEVTPPKAKNLDFSDNRYKYKVSNPNKDNNEFVSVVLTQEDIDLASLASTHNTTNYDGNPEVVNNILLYLDKEVQPVDKTYSEIFTNIDSVRELLITPSNGRLNNDNYSNNFLAMAVMFFKEFASDGVTSEVKTYLTTATLTRLNKTTGSD